MLVVYWFLLTLLICTFCRDEDDQYFKTLRDEIVRNPKVEDLVTKKMFKANPVPAHARLRLYDKMVAEQEKRYVLALNLHSDVHSLSIFY